MRADAPAPPAVAGAEPWPEADALFRSDPRWLGSDDAYSVPLGGDRSLWLFGDTFVADPPGPARAGSAFVRNSIAISEGADPARASIRFHRGTAGGAPADVFPAAEAGTWLWPFHGARLGGPLVLFFMTVRPPSPSVADDALRAWREEGSLGFFDVYGWTARLIENPDDEPAAWRARAIPVPETRGVALGAAVLAEDGWLHAYGWREQARQIYLARWPLPDAAAGRLGAPQWWLGDAWGAGEPAAVIEPGATEFTVHRDARSGRLVQAQMWSRTDQAIVLRWADEPQGPWSPPARAFVPEEAARADAFTYAVKAHPELEGADLVLTYASNGEVDTTLADASIYFPRFVRVRLEAP